MVRKLIKNDLRHNIQLYYFILFLMQDLFDYDFYLGQIECICPVGYQGHVCEICVNQTEPDSYSRKFPPTQKISITV